MDIGARVSLDVNVENMSGIWPCETAACPLLAIYLQMVHMRAGQGTQFLPALVIVHANGAASSLSRLCTVFACLCHRPLTLAGRRERRKAGNLRECGAAGRWGTDIVEDGQQCDGHLSYTVGSHGMIHLKGVRIPLRQVDHSGRRRMAGVAHCGRCGRARRGHDEIR